jgi:hypothetical protein
VESRSHPNEYGMFCDNECGLEVAKKMKEALDSLLGMFEG